MDTVSASWSFTSGWVADVKKVSPTDVCNDLARNQPGAMGSETGGASRGLGLRVEMRTPA